MGETKYTPGPWEWNVAFNDSGGQYYQITSSAGWGGAFPLADEIRSDNKHDVIVMATAPELLEALERVFEWAAPIAGDNQDSEAALEEDISIAQAHKAIAKAKGNP